MKHVLVVDDDMDIRAALSQILRQEGFRVIAAENGKEALRELRNGHDFCLILLDLIMPEMDGEEFLQEQKKDPQLANIPVIAMTAGKRLPQGVSAAIAKPIDLDALLETINGHCTQ